MPPLLPDCSGCRAPERTATLPIHARPAIAVPFLFGLLLVTSPAAAQRPKVSNAVRPYVAVDAAIVALTHARVIDGTGALPREDQTVLVRDGRIAAVGGKDTTVPEGAQVIDLTGKSVIPGLVMVHEHLHYPTGPGVYANVSESFIRLYLAGGVTSMRTAGSLNPYAEINLKKSIDRGGRAGPWIDVTAPYLQGPGLGVAQMHELTGPDDARKLIAYWSDAGATSLKAFMHVTRDVLEASLAEGHARGMKLTGHLCAVTYREAARLGIDNLEHGFLAATDFVPDKKPDVCPDQGAVLAAIAAVDVDGDAARSLIRELVERKVAVTSTLTIYETFTPGRPLPPGLDVLDPILREQLEQRHAAMQKDTGSIFPALLAKARQMEIAFFRAGGMLLAGTDPTGGGGVIAGYSNQRAIELLVESGLTPLEAIKVATLNGATYLGRADRVGTIASGRQADLVVIDGNPAARIEDIRKVSLVFKQGIGFDPARLIASVKGRVGLY